MHTYTPAQVFSRAQLGIEAPLVSVEVHIGGGLPRFTIVGLPETAVRESKDRVRSALLNSRFDFPPGRITVNLAPADLPKEGGRFDLPIAIGILAATSQIDTASIAGLEFIGELGLMGDIRGVQGVLPAAIESRNAARGLIVAEGDGCEAQVVSAASVFIARHLLDVCSHLGGAETLERAERSVAINTSHYPDLKDVKGQHQARRALEVAAAGAHNLLMSGPPGTGKTMLATRLPGILPELDEPQAIQTAAIRSVSTLPSDFANWRQRPFRAPHHTASGVALVGGGSKPKPGEISLAHNGILFLDELPEYDRRVLEVLREPLESRFVTISRAAAQVRYPARFQLVAAMNPCPCGWLGDPSGRCHCTPDQIQRYHARISGPLLDRIDIHVEVPALDPKYFQAEQIQGGESSQVVRERVASGHAFQLNRAGKLNCDLTPREVDRDCKLSRGDRELLKKAAEKFGLSARAWHRVLRVARTIADLSGVKSIDTEHLMEAIGYRSLDRRASADSSHGHAHYATRFG